MDRAGRIWADVNDSPHEAAEREVWEESGFRVKVTKLAAVYDRAKHPHEPPLPFHVYKMFFICEILSGEATPSRETPEVGFLPWMRCRRCRFRVCWSFKSGGCLNM